MKLGRGARCPSLLYSPLHKPTWETAASLWAVVRAGGAEILWLVVWDSMRQSIGQSVVGNEKEGYSGG